MKLEIIKDILGQPYIGIKYIINNDIVKYYDILFDYCNKNNIEYNTLLYNKHKRDGNEHLHITVFNSMECKKYNHLLQYNNDITDIKLLNIGSINKDDNITFYIVVKSEQLDNLLIKENLKYKNFHITLGFKNKDLFHLPKNENTFISL